MKVSEEGETSRAGGREEWVGTLLPCSHLHHLYACGNRTLRTNVSPVPSIKRKVHQGFLPRRHSNSGK